MATPPTFSLKYPFPSMSSTCFADYVFTAMSAGPRDSNQPVKVTSPHGTNFMLYGLKFVYGPKPIALPFGRDVSSKRFGNFVVDAYLPSDSMQQTIHFANPAGPSDDIVSANNSFQHAMASAFLHDSKTFYADVRVSRPRSVPDVMKSAKGASIITEVGTPREYDPSEISSFGLDVNVVGWGEAIHKAYLGPTRLGSKIDERVTGVELKHLATIPTYCTQYFLVTIDGTHCVAEVPWREDNSLFNQTSPIRKDLEGKEMFRAVGPADACPGSLADVEIQIQGTPISKSTGEIKLRQVLKAVYFQPPLTDFKHPKATVRPGILPREEAVFALAEMAMRAAEGPSDPASDPVSLPVPKELDFETPAAPAGTKRRAVSDIESPIAPPAFEPKSKPKSRTRFSQSAEEEE